jgi:hypothetical protein
MRRRRPGYTDNINAQRQFLPGIIQAKADREALKAAQAMNEKRLGLEERQLGISEGANRLTEQQIAEQARANAASADYNNRSLALTQKSMDYTRDAAEKGAGLEALKFGLNMSGKNPMSSMSGAPNWVQKTGGILAPAASGALAGYGGAKLLGGKSKTKKLMFGAGAGLLSGIMGGNWGDWGKMAGSGFGGLVGGLFA